MKARISLSVDRLKEVVHYDPETGIFTRRALPGNERYIRSINSRFAGKPLAPARKVGYAAAHIDGRSYYLHRLAYLYMTGEMAPIDVDHINGDKYDNRWVNLRAATVAENAYNSRARQTYKSTRLKGVTYLPKQNKYRSQIRANGVVYPLGVFDTEESAHAAYRAAAVVHHGEYARLD